ncbi:biofilm and cell wall regulator 1 [Exophiala oligosperma]|uniref:Biofilm and cell wall regulator 1 n=2 Tax=Chaetothyriales TaxID=34395 RepID=A0A0D2C1P6_9EURO|nr:biofilm and cell wall regulator 1 [Exophiala oligosperma]KAJ9631290.1 Up in starvation [Knufia peltigerae]KIW43637.1 biofilm and cell wall regulator 1 [Exophiala oligosperma]
MAALSLVLSETMPPNDRMEEMDTPTTPRPTRYTSATLEENHVVLDNRSSHPGNDSSGQAYNNSAHEHRHSDTTRRDSGGAATSVMDVDDDDDDEDNDPHGSDHEGEQGEADSAWRKKKGQRFFCTGYPPCNLSFTRSEHLARHIRKHTGERPFQCHCNRRFSRLDNLRQHAQTVHVNEEIPTDSLAATGTRFQRQIRTDRVRPTGRPRTGTAGSAGGHSRGHSRNLSTSSVGSTSSNYSIVTDAKRRPPPLLMAGDGSGRLSLGLDPPQTPPAQYRGYNPNSPGGLSTPTSAQFSATPGSPGFMSSLGSPTSSSARLGGFFSSAPHARRLSVPSGPSPYQQQYPPGYSTPYMNQIEHASSHGSSNSSMFTSPTSSSFPMSPGHHMVSGEDWRRRTWHPSTMPAANLNYNRPATSGLTYSQTPDAPQPAHAQHATAAAGQAPRLPGIESFDHVQHRTYTPPRRNPSPMLVDPSLTDPNLSSSVTQQESQPRPGHVSWEGPRPSQYPELEEGPARNQIASSWGQQTINEIQSVGVRRSDTSRQVDMGPPSNSMTLRQQQQMAQDALEAQASANRFKRQGWYQGPVSAARTSPEDSSSSDGVPTPGMTAVEVHPMIMHSSGYMEPQHAALPADGHQNVCLAPAAYIENNRHRTSSSFGDRTGRGGDLNRLEALVAVATSGDNGAR